MAAASAAAAAAAASTVVAAAASAVVASLRKRGMADAPGAARSYVKRARNDRAGDFDLDAMARLLERLGVGFESYFRLPRHLFNEILNDIRPALEQTRPTPRMGVNATGHCITPEHRLAVALRFFAGAQWQDIVVGLRPVSRAEVYDSVWMVVDAVNNAYAGKWDYPRPAEGAPAMEWSAANEFYSKLAIRFREKSPGHCMSGVIGAIDGCIIPVHSPGRSVPNASDHWCERKKTHGMLLMAVSDADMVIRNWSVAYTPKCHDSTAWAGSELGAWVNGGGVPWPFCFLGDSAFRPGNAGLITPGTASSTSDAFKYVQSRGRMPAEQSFGILLRTWGVLWRKLTVHHTRRGPLVSALIHLHNVRRCSAAPFNIEDSHRVRVHDGVRQWGITERGVQNGIDTMRTVWTTAPVIDEHGRLTELCGGLKEAFQDGVPFEQCSADQATAAARVQMLEDAITEGGITRPE